jgi:hypothetical protein
MYGQKYKDVKPILAFHGLKTDDEIEWAVLNNIRDVETLGAYFSSDHLYAQEYITRSAGRIMLFLILTGKTQSFSDYSTKQPKNEFTGCES